jgi:predicted nucleic acid-binding protein
LVYADTDFFVALIKEDDWLQEAALQVYDEKKGDIQTGITTFVELFFLSQRHNWNREEVASNILEIAETDFDESVIFQASEYIDQGLNVLDAFQAAKADGEIISSDKDFDDLEIERIKLEDHEE